MKTRQKHAAKIIQWAQDTSQSVWYWSTNANAWLDTYDPSWADFLIYVLGEKPTAPPRKMCTLGGLEFPAPETVAPENRQSTKYKGRKMNNQTDLDKRLAHELEDARINANQALSVAELAWYKYARLIDLGPDRERAFEIYQNVRLARRP